MSKPSEKTLSVAALLMLFVSTTYAGEKLEVKVIDRQNNAGSYTYVVPGYGNCDRDVPPPLVNNIRAEFDGDKAKLIWPVSIDGKKMESETYKILAVLDKP